MLIGIFPIAILFNLLFIFAMKIGAILFWMAIGAIFTLLLQSVLKAWKGRPQKTAPLLRSRAEQRRFDPRATLYDPKQFRRPRRH